MQYFWEKSGKKSRARFNLLLLEYGEYFLEDVSAFQYPSVPIWSDKLSIMKCDTAKIQGRIKLCSRSLMFEPNDIKKPIIKIPFKSIVSEISEPRYGVKQSIPGIDMNSFFIMTFKNYFEMKANDKIGPYLFVDCRQGGSSEDDFSHGHGCFSLAHSDLKIFLSKLDLLYRGFVADNALLSEKILRPLLSKASAVTFDSSMLVDFHEQWMLEAPLPVKKIRPLINNPGSLMVTTSRVYFQPSQLNNLGDSFQCFELNKVDRIFCRRHLLQQTGLEFILKDGTSHFFAFDYHSIRNKVFSTINMRTNIMSHTKSLEEVTRMWQRREKSNFEYLMYLNSEADRSFNDITQYPVFPHILHDYTSATLDFENPASYRDLSKPMGALSPSRLEYFKERYNSMPPANEDFGIPPPFLYGTHYSTPAYILFYLVRVAPEHMLCLQNGKFDATDRMFNSIADTWESCLNNPADLKESIPEFYSGNGEFLLNMADLDLGHRHTGGRLNDVELPPWAKNSKDFIRKCSKALESNYVSAHIHQWIDLIFGYKSMGIEAANADNLYYYLTYEGAVDLDNITDPQKRTALEIQIQEFGQTPKQLFSGPHPARDDHHAEIHFRSRPGRTDMKTLSTSTSAINIRSTSPQPASLPSASSYETVEIINLGDDFRADVERALSVDNVNPSSKLVVISNPNSRPTSIGENTPSSKLSSTSAAAATPSPVKESTSQKIASFFSDFAFKTASVTDRTLGTKLLPTLSTNTSSPKPNPDKVVLPSSTSSTNFNPSTPISSFDTVSSSSSSSSSKRAVDEAQSQAKSQASKPIAADKHVSMNRQSSKLMNSAPITPRITSIPIHIKQIMLLPCEIPFKAHTDIVTGISLFVEPLLDQDSDMLMLPSSWKATISSASKDATLKILEANSDSMILSSKRSFIGSDAALTCTCLMNDGKSSYFGSWDNHVYSYSISNARLLSKQLVHDDGVISICIDEHGKHLLTGACDGAVKLWKIKNGGLSSVPLTEFYDHENPVTSVALTCDARYAAAGSEDGKVIMWDTHTGAESSTLQISYADRGSIFVHWIPASEVYYQQIDFSMDKLLASSYDGKLTCFDVTGRLFAAATLDVAVLCLDCDGAAIYGGCDDGTVRVWILEGGLFKEMHRYLRAHQRVTAICVDRRFRVLVTGGSEGTVRIWKTYE